MVGGSSGTDLWQQAPCYLGLFRTDGTTLAASDRLVQNMPEVQEGLTALLECFHIDPPLEHGLNTLPDKRSVKHLARRDDGSIWRLRLCADRSADLISLQAEDITGGYEERLRRRLLLELIEKTPDGIGIAREDRTGMWLNDAMKTLLDVHAPEEISRRSIKDAHPRGIGGHSVDEALAIAREQGFFQDETLLTDIHGNDPREVSQVIIAHHDPLLDQHFFSTIVRDISTLKETQRALTRTREELRHLLELKDRDLNREKQALDQSRDVWRSLVEQNRDLVLFTNVEGTILFCNNGFLPQTAHNLNGSSVYSLIAPPDRVRVLEQFQSLLDGSTAHINTEARIMCPDGELRFCVLLINRLEKSDGFHAATWIISDATESRDIREQMQANEKMAATGRMAARIAHEINNPLAAIKSSLELVRLDVGEEHAASEYIRLMDAELNRVSKIIRQMYGLYQPEQDKPRELNINNIISDCVTLLKSTANHRGIRIDQRDTAPLPAQASEAGARQILFNIIQNAIDVSGEGGRIRVESEVVEDKVLVRVMDEGPGLDESRGREFFEPFYTTKDSFAGAGLGLGLSVSASLAKGMGADLQLSNMPGGGACATLTLRAVPEHNP